RLLYVGFASGLGRRFLLSQLAPVYCPCSRACPARPRPPHPDSPHARQPAEAAGHPLPGPGRLPEHLHPSLRPPQLPLSARRPPAPRPACHLPRAGQDPLRLRPQGPAPRGAGMDRRTQAAQATAPRDPPPQPGPDPHPRPAPPPQGGASLIIGPAFVLTVRHSFP